MSLFNCFRILLVFTLLNAGLSFSQPNYSSPIRLQLAWSHQSQFAGVYVAQVRKHFRNEGIDLIVVPGGSGINPISELQAGNADVAISWFNNAYELSTPDKPVTNIAQIFSGSALNIACRISAGVYSPADIRGKKIGIWGVGDQKIVYEWLDHLKIPKDSVEVVYQQPNGQDLIDGKVACATIMAYNEYWNILRSGIADSDLVIVDPQSYGVFNLEDGLYVMRERLEDPFFREQMVRLIRALRKGWAEARIAPSLAAQAVQAYAPRLDSAQQLHELQVVLDLIPKDKQQFGLLNLGKYEKSVQRLSASDPNTKLETSTLWTHTVWDELQKQDGKQSPLTAATSFYISEIVNSYWFEFFIYLAAFTFALSGTLEGINRNYDLWGRLILAFLSGVGGGTIRDIIIGGDRLDLYYVKDVVFPTGILLIVLAASLIVMKYRNFHHTDAFKSIKKYTDIIGFAGLATLGAMLTLAAGRPWFWAPICAALSCAGGGMLRDVLVNQEPQTFKGVIYEEAAVVGGLVLTAGLFISNYYESSPIPVLLSVVLTFFFVVILRLLISKYSLQYPEVLGGPKKENN